MTNPAINELLKTVKELNKKEKFQEVINLLPVSRVLDYKSDKLNIEFAKAFAASADAILKAHYEEAITNLGKAIRLDPKNAAYHFMLAQIKAYNKYYDDVLRGFTQSSTGKTKKVKRPSTHDIEIVEEIEQLLGRKLTIVYEDEPDSELAEDEPGCEVDKDGFVHELSLCNTGIKKLDKIIPLIKELDPLTILDLSKNSIRDISLLSQLTDLTYLKISDNKISDLSPLTKFTELADLIAGNNPLVDITPLAPLVNLELLYLTNAKISDISALKGMTKLTNLALEENQISDISVLQSMKELTDLYLSGNRISDISPLQGNRLLEQVWLDDNQIEALPPWILDWGLAIVWDEFPKKKFVNVLNNPFKKPPIEIIKGGNRAIKAWFAAKR